MGLLLGRPVASRTSASLPLPYLPHPWSHSSSPGDLTPMFCQHLECSQCRNKGDSEACVPPWPWLASSCNPWAANIWVVLTVFSVVLRISRASSNVHGSSMHSVSKEPGHSSSRKELARLCLRSTPCAASWVMNTGKRKIPEMLWPATPSLHGATCPSPAPSAKEVVPLHHFRRASHA